ncbi:hypothetical protein IQ235_09485 [Oscillatoriales cyanobacterium LEGE 11467]|uniref:STAS domain-containing protein n=1 Tax=Zarconia navalis LEGE 11467 TaxID=1828826 RepID=A0A928VZ75_9CYAN|nr:STAS domain-containing protein [Zarconia navalis]MBE9041011.1 hypothetical protein [Zarconia navalis LEGE 11467]
MEITMKDCFIRCDREKAIVDFQNPSLSGGENCAFVSKFLNFAIETQPPFVVLNLQGLQSIDSSGIKMLSKFVIQVRHQKRIHMTVLGSKEIGWHQNSLTYLRSLMPSLRLELT